MKIDSSKMIIAILFFIVLAFSVFNTDLILKNSDALKKQHDEAVSALNTDLDSTFSTLNERDMEIQQFYSERIQDLNARLPIEQYDFVIYRYWSDVGSIYIAKNGRTRTVDFNSTDASFVFNNALTQGNSIFVKSDEYDLTSDVFLTNKKNARLDSDGATLNLNGHKIIVYGLNFTYSQNNQICGFRIVNGTIRIENSFRTNIVNIIFENSSVGVELTNTNTWTEGTTIDAIHFCNCVQGIIFRTNTSDTTAGIRSTGSYGNTAITRAYFNQLDNSIAITVEKDAEFTDGHIQNVRIWIGEFGNFNQTGLLLNLNASMYQTLLDGVVFESFAKGDLANSLIYAVYIEKTVFQTPILQAGVSFLGDWTARINNRYGNWISSGGSLFKLENISIPVAPFDFSRKPEVIQLHPQRIASFKPRIIVHGNFSQNETVKVRFRLEFVDNSVSPSVEKSFQQSDILWLDDKDLMVMYPSVNVIWAILVDATVNTAFSDAEVEISLIGTTA